MAIFKLLIAASLTIPFSGFTAGKCGFPMLQNKYGNMENFEKASPLGAPAAPEFASRSYETEHFTIHYTLYSLHSVLMTSGDYAIQIAFDSLVNKTEPSNYQDYQNILNVMDNNSVKHPEFILKMGGYFEKAFAFYVDSLNMDWQRTTMPSRFYQKPSVPGKYQVEVVDINKADKQFAGKQIYGLAYPPWDLGGGIAMENDFWWDSSTLGSGEYIAVSSEYYRGPENQIIDYTEEWEKGLKVTTSHEFYHVIQYGYTGRSHFSNFHFWYEASATGMEDIMADEVNDYYQYLPLIIDGHASRGLSHVCGKCNEPYGNGIFLHFLLYQFDAYFDKKVWQNLRDDPNIMNAFNNAFSSYNSSFSESYPIYASQLIYNQKNNSPFTSFNNDIVNWPLLTKKPLDQSQGDKVNLQLPPLSFEVYNLSGDNNSLRQKISMISGENVTVMFIYNNEVGQADLDIQGDSYILPLPEDFSKENILFISNNSTEAYANIDISSFLSVKDSSVYAFPNPYTMGKNSSSLLFTKPFSPDSITFLEIFSEFGELVQKLEFNADNLDWSWDLKNRNGIQILPGVYFLKIPGSKLQPVVITQD